MDDSSRRFEAVKVGEQRDKGRRLQEWMDGWMDGWIDMF